MLLPGDLVLLFHEERNGGQQRGACDAPSDGAGHCQESAAGGHSAASGSQCASAEPSHCRVRRGSARQRRDCGARGSSAECCGNPHGGGWGDAGNGHARRDAGAGAGCRFSCRVQLFASEGLRFLEASLPVGHLLDILHERLRRVRNRVHQVSNEVQQVDTPQPRLVELDSFRFQIGIGLVVVDDGELVLIRFFRPSILDALLDPIGDFSCFARNGSDGALGTGCRSACGICGSFSHIAEHFHHMFRSWTLRLGRCVNVSLVSKFIVVFEALRLWAVLDHITNALNGILCLACDVSESLSRLIGSALRSIRCLFGSTCDSFSCSGRSFLCLFYWVESFIKQAHRPAFPRLQSELIIPPREIALSCNLTVGNYLGSSSCSGQWQPYFAYSPSFITPNLSPLSA